MASILFWGHQNSHQYNMSMIHLKEMYTWYVEIKCHLDETEDFIADLIACSTCFRHHYAHHQELKSIIQWLLPVVFRAVVFQVAGLVWSRGLCVRFAAPHQTSYLKNHSTKYHTQQPLYNTLELLMMGIVMPETCWASNKICNLFPHKIMNLRVQQDAESFSTSWRPIVLMESSQLWRDVLIFTYTAYYCQAQQTSNIINKCYMFRLCRTNIRH